MFAALILTGCQSPTPPLYKINVNSALTPKEAHELVATLQQSGVQFVQQGSRLKLYLPIDEFFEQQTTELRSGQQITLKYLALYLYNYTHVVCTRYPIKIIAYADKTFPPKQRYQLSKQYATTIAAYLWNYGFTPEQLQPMGFGARCPVGDNLTAHGSAANRRVMIQVN